MSKRAFHENFEGFLGGKRNRDRSVDVGTDSRDLARASPLGRFLLDDSRWPGPYVCLARAG